MMKQSDAVFNAVVNVCGKQDGAYKPTKEQRAQIAMILFQSFEAGKVELKRGFDAEYVKSYIPGLITNWLNKDKRLNGGTKYEAKNPGSRAGSSDPQVKAMRALLSTLTDEADRQEVQEAISKRLEAIAPSKTVEINIADLPESLRAKYSA